MSRKVNNVIAQVLGGERQIVDNVVTVGDVRGKMNLDRSYQATVDQEPADDGDEVESGNYVAFTRKTKGGAY